MLYSFFRVLITSLLILFSSEAFAQLQFQEMATSLGCANTSYGTGALGGGISFFDFDSDGWDDLTIASETGQSIRFFKNNGGTFTEVSFGLTNQNEVKTVQWVDYDNDGDYDFMATSNVQENYLYQNDGAMNFTDVTAAVGLSLGTHKSFGSSWGDYNNDGWLDVFICSRDGESLVNFNELFRNNGDGTFTNVSTSAGILQNNYFSFCSSFFDYNNDGWQDIYIANDRDPENQLYRNNGDGTFTEVGIATGTGLVMDAMSTTIGDHNQDGYWDIYVTNTHDGNAFLENSETGTFTDVAPANGTGFYSVGWGAVFLDADNDADIDLYVSGMLDGTSGDLPSAFYLNDGSGNYTIPSGIGFENDTAASFGNAIGDTNNDGFPEIAVLNYDPDDIFLFQNQTSNSNNWLKVKLEGTESNRMGIGSVIEISVDGTKQYNYTLCGEGYLGQNSAYEFFGIGAATEIDYMKITWLSGIVDYIENPAINTHHTIVEGTFLSIGEEELSTGIQLFPNPAYRQVTVSGLEAYVDGTVQLIDAMGRELFSHTIETETKLLPLEALSAGLYYVQISKGKHSVSRKLMVH